MKILITGANGMLGEKCSSMLSANHKILSTDIQDNSIGDSTNDYQSLDIIDKKKNREIIEKFQPDVLLNCAAFTNVDGAERDKKKAYEINVLGVKNLADALVGMKCHFIQISTDYVFNGLDGPYDENASTDPINYYGESKLEAEKVLEKYDFPVTIVRTNVIFGGSKKHKASFVDWVIDSLQKHETISIVNDQYNNPTWTDSLVAVFEKIIEKKATGLFHFGGKNYINRMHFALKISDVFKLNPQKIKPITTRTLGQLAKRPYKSGLITDKIEQELGVKVHDIQEALMAMRDERKKI